MENEAYMERARESVARWDEDTLRARAEARKGS